MTRATVVSEEPRDTAASRSRTLESMFGETRQSAEALQLPESAARTECFCPSEVFMSWSIVYQPLPLINAAIRGRVWNPARPLLPSERLPESVPDQPRAPDRAVRSDQLT